jgi:acyl-CoA synthetase (AMP-forming)/AMP-acid ligase II
MAQAGSNLPGRGAVRTREDIMSAEEMAAASSAYAYPLLIKQLLHTPMALAADQEIVYRDQIRYRYRDFRGRLARVANVLASLGVKHGSTVAVMDWDSHRYLECYFAVPMMGATLVTANVRLNPQQIAYCLNHAKAEVLLVHRDFLPVIEQLRGHLPGLDRFVLIADGDDSTPPPGFAGEYEGLLAAADASYEFAEFDENTRATSFYTTGTTGQPKAVAFSHRQIVLHTLAIGLNFAMPPAGQRFHWGDVYMPMTPMFHVHAWGFPFLATLLGVKQVYPGRYQPASLLNLIATERVSFSHCVPSILQMVLDAPESAATDLKGWKLVVGGSALTIGLARRAAERGIEVWCGYGMSETGPILTSAQVKPGLVLDAEHQLSLRCKTGKPLPLVDLRIVDPEMRDLPHDGKSVGEVVARAPWLTQAYGGDLAASEQLWHGGYLHTQDVANIDPNGYVQITDRLKDVIKSGGEWVSSLDLESLISRHPAVAEVAVIGVPDARWGERPLALVVPRAEAKAAVGADSIKSHLLAFVTAGTLSKTAIPERIVFVDAIDKTSVGKIDKKLLRQKYGTGISASA